MQASRNLDSHWCTATFRSTQSLWPGRRRAGCSYATFHAAFQLLWAFAGHREPTRTPEASSVASFRKNYTDFRLRISRTRDFPTGLFIEISTRFTCTRNSINIDWCGLNLKTCNDAHRDDRFLSTVSKNHIYILCLHISQMFPKKFVKARPLFLAIYVYVDILIGIRSLRYAIMTYQLQKRFIKMFRVFGYVVGRRYRKVTLMTNRWNVPYGGVTSWLETKWFVIEPSRVSLYAVRVLSFSSET